MFINIYISPVNVSNVTDAHTHAVFIIFDYQTVARYCCQAPRFSDRSFMSGYRIGRLKKDVTHNNMIYLHYNLISRKYGTVTIRSRFPKRIKKKTK